ncbi:MAG: hypothetical protein ACJAUV_002357, partial [Flavobacteriales bacterium]
VINLDYAPENPLQMELVSKHKALRCFT